jgi:hypothetical protein
MGPFFVASRTPVQGWIGSGEQKRFSILRLSEYGTPRKELTPSFVNPLMSPKLVFTIGLFLKLEISSS